MPFQDSLRFTIINARVVTPDEEFLGWIEVADGAIARVEPGGPPSNARGDRIPCCDFQGDYCLPGFVELHTDNLEKSLMPRPGVKWPTPVAGVVTHDRQLVAAGITTVLDSISVGEFDEKSRRRELFEDSLAALDDARQAGLLLADHHLHLRCELGDPAVVEMFESAVDHEALRLASLMDHTPGQRQWRDLALHKAFYAGKRGMSGADYDALLGRALERARLAAPNRERILALCRARGLPMASHDDTTVEHARESAADGLVFSEFPTTLEAAREAKTFGLAVVMGAPNVVRGESHSGNVSARELAERGLLDALSSDYFPPSLIEAVFALAESGLSLPKAARLITRTPADLGGFTDRGRLAPSAKADLVRARRVGQNGNPAPVVLSVWREGRRVL